MSTGEEKPHYSLKDHPNMDAGPPPGERRVSRKEVSKQQQADGESTGARSQDKPSKQLGISISDVFKNKLKEKSPAMEKQQHLIEKLIQAKADVLDRGATETCRDIKLKEVRQWTGREVLQRCGLQEVSTPATGNSQYYAIAMALLQKGFDTPDNKTAIEFLTGKLKKGIVVASNHFFEQEFPHDIREAILSTIEPVKERHTPQQSERAMKRYLREIG
ncbi:hypothetical protein GN244_ATG12393 [Phytophthora infestans]|uniref:Uncharacterized protein n=1 Tax=Phytophthora infestans TaxID=4787 RepID=A0A833SYU9_PHYIN|nr:hypothetical protein GN244_ATG12393 [Phytophthora infestans]KAF4143907.1 hypothetical protein GN958_ATG06993 [Phytophthora infestans]